MCNQRQKLIWRVLNTVTYQINSHAHRGVFRHRAELRVRWKTNEQKPPPQPSSTRESTGERRGKRAHRTLVLLYKLFESCESSLDTAARRDGVIRGNDMCWVHLSRNLTWLVKAGQVSVEEWKLDSSVWTWKESRSLLFFIIFASVLNFESLLIVDSFPAIRGKVSALHDVSLPAAPCLGTCFGCRGIALLAQHHWSMLWEGGYGSNLDCWDQMLSAFYF